MMLTIKQLKSEQLAEAVEVACQCFGEKIRADATADFSAGFADYSFRPKTYVGLVDDKIVGLIQSLTTFITPKSQSFCWLCVLPEHRLKHYGRALLNYAEQDTITNKFGQEDGTFLLVSGYDPEYYKSVGYMGDLLTHDNHPFMVKHYRAKRGN